MHYIILQDERTAREVCQPRIFILSGFMSVVYYVCLNLLTELWWCVWMSASRAAGGRFLSMENAFETACMGS